MSKPARVPPTLEQFKQWAKDCAPAAKAVLMAQAFAELERKRVDAYIRPIFEKYQPWEVTERWRDKGVQIRTERDLYLCEDEPQLKAYYAECDEAHRAHGFKGEAGKCPALVAEHLHTIAERCLIELAQPLTGIEDVYGEDRKKYLDILIGACAPHMTKGF